MTLCSQENLSFIRLKKLSVQNLTYCDFYPRLCSVSEILT